MSTPDLGFAHRYRPPANEGAPVLLLLHGTGGSESDLLPLADSLWPEAGYLSPRGKVLEQGMPRFFRRIAEGVFDLEDLRHRAGELGDFVTAAAAVYRFEDHRVVAVGFSNGANIAAALMLLRPNVLHAAVLFRVMVPLVPDTLPALNGKQVLISNGELDPLVPKAETERLAALLRSAGAAVSVEWQASGHQLTPRDFAAAQAWMAAGPWRRTPSQPTASLPRGEGEG